MTPLGAPQVQDDWQAGAQADIAPNLIDPRGFLQGMNALLDYAGVPTKRGGSEKKSVSSPLSSANFIWDGEFPVGQRTVFGGPEGLAVLDDDDEHAILLPASGMAPQRAALVNGYLFTSAGIYAGAKTPTPTGGGTINVTNGTPNVVGVGTHFATAAPGTLIRPTGGRAYTVAAVIDANTLTLAENYKGTTATGLTYTLGPIVSYSDPYYAADFYATVANRLILAINPATIRFSRVNDPHTYKATDYYTLPEGVRIIGMAPVQQDLLIFTTKGIWLLRGLAYEMVDPLGNPQQSLTQVSDSIIAWGNQAIVPYSGALVVPTIDGCVIVNAAGVQSDLGRYAVRRKIARSAEQNYKPGQAAVYRDTYLLPILDAANGWIDTIVCKLDLPVRTRSRPAVWPWTQLSGAGAENVSYAVRPPSSGPVIGTGEPELLAGHSEGLLLDCNGFFEPDDGNAKDHDNSVPEFDIVTRDYPSVPGVGATGRFRRMRILYEMVATDAFPNPTIDAAIGSAGLSTAVAEWDEVKWGEFLWSADDAEAGGFTSLAGEYGPDPAVNKASWNITRYAPYARFRIRSTDPVAKLSLRALELFTVEPGSPRRSRSTTTPP